MCTRDCTPIIEFESDGYCYCINGYHKNTSDFCVKDCNEFLYEFENDKGNCECEALYNYNSKGVCEVGCKSYERINKTSKILDCLSCPTG